MFGLKEAELAQLVRAVAGDNLQRAEIEERFARAAWTGIAEPGDGIAGLAVEVLGAPGALSAVVEHWSAPQLAAALGGAVEVDIARQALERWLPRLNSASALVALRQAARLGVRLGIPGDDGWPSGLADLGAHAPIALWIRGTDDAYRSLSHSIALVGARAATGYGEHVTMEASAGLVDRGYTIVSGAAYGIDGMAHRAALASHGSTVAFLAGGVDRFYPSGHDALLTRIVEHGCVISELPCGASPTKWRFLQRNRLIAATSLATIVLEAGWRSGSLNTAGHAATVGRPIGAVPGPVTSAASAGCHRLIREFQAILVTTPEEMAELAPLESTAGRAADRTADRTLATDDPTLDAAAPATHTRVLDALSTRAPRAANDIAARSGLSVADVQSVLGQLDLDGSVRERESGWTKASQPKSGPTLDG